MNSSLDRANNIVFRHQSGDQDESLSPPSTLPQSNASFPGLKLLLSFLSVSPLQNHFPALHGLRIIAVVLIIQVHVTECLHRSGFLTRFANAGVTASVKSLFGMDFLFLLSGFLIGMILLHYLKQKQSAKTFLRFYARRAFRILPIYYCVLFGLILLFGLTEYQSANLWREIFYLSNYPSDDRLIMHWSWSLSVEEHFYLTIPFFMLLLYYIPSHGGRLTLLALLWLSGAWVRYSLASELFFPVDYDKVRAIYANTHTRYDLFFAGIFTAYVQMFFPRGLRAFFAWKHNQVLFLIVPLAILMFIAYPDIDNGNPWSNPLTSWNLHLALSLGTYTGIAYTMLVLWCLNTPSFLRNILSHRSFLWMASLSYGVYLVHLPILQEVVIPILETSYNFHGGAFWVYWWIALSSTFLLANVVAYILHILCEKPFLVLRERLAPSLSLRAEPIPSEPLPIATKTHTPVKADLASVIG